MTRKWNKFSRYFENADCQLHTIYTDGLSTPEEYFRKAEENGLDFILFSEHVRRVTTYDYLKFKEHVYKAGAASRVKFAVGAEAKVLDVNGNIDISEEVAKEAEMILFSFHTPDFDSLEKYMAAIENAARNPLVDVFAHPTMYHNWMGISVDADSWIRLLTVLSDSHVCYEFNKKYDLPGSEELLALRSTLGKVQFVYGSDAHTADSLLNKNMISDFKQLVRGAE